MKSTIQHRYHFLISMATTCLLLCSSVVQGQVTSDGAKVHDTPFLRSSLPVTQDFIITNEDTSTDEDAERELGRSKGSKGSKGSGRRGPSCGLQCGDKDFAYIHLTGSYFFGEVNDDLADVPIEGSGRLNTTKDGSTLLIFEENLHGTATYFDHGDAHPNESDITGIITGSCTILATYPGNSTQVASEGCLAHCTICVSYIGKCCDKYDYDAWDWNKDEKNCTSFGGFATVTGDLFFDIELSEIGSLVPLTLGGLVSLDGFGAITGTSGELGPASNGGLGFIEYDAFDQKEGDKYKIGLKVPFNDQESCKLQDHVAMIHIPPAPAPSPTPTPTPTTTPGTTMVQVKAFREDPTSQPIEGVIISIDDISVGTTGPDGSIMVELVIGLEYKIHALEIGLVGGTTSFMADGVNTVVSVVMKGDDGVVEEAALVVSAVENNVLPLDFTALALSFVRPSGDDVPLSFFDYVFLESLQDPDTKVDVTNLFQLDAASNEQIVLKELEVETFRTILQGFPFGEVKIEAYGEDAIGLIYSDVLGFFIGSITISGVLSTPPSNPSLAVDGLTVEAKFLVSSKVPFMQMSSDAAGSFSFQNLPPGNWELTASTEAAGLVYNAFATINAQAGSSVLVDMTLRTTVDIINNVPPFSVSSQRVSSFQKSNQDQVYAERESLQEMLSKEQASLLENTSILSADSASVSVTSAGEGAAITDSASLTVPMGTEKVLLTYLVASIEYPFFVLSQSIFNDVWSLNVIVSSGAQIFQITRQVNSMIFVPPFWQSNGTTGEITEEFDVSTLTTMGDIEMVVSASATNIGDSVLPTTVQAEIGFTPVLRINELIADTVSPTKGDSSYYSIPRSGSSNTFQRAYTLKISRPDMTVITKVTAKLMSGSTELMTLVDEAPGGALVTEQDSETLKVSVTSTGSNPSTVASTPPTAHNIFYRFVVEGEVDGTTVSDQKDTNPRKALWKLPDAVGRKGYRDPGGDGWCAKGTYEWLTTNAALLPRVDDISGEHSRNIGHSTHFRGTDLDTYHFTDLVGSPFNGNDNYIKLRDDVISALGGNEMAKTRVTGWMTDSRTGLDNLAALSTVASMIYHRGAAFDVLNGGWAAQLLTTGQVTDTMARTLDLEIGSWSQTKVTAYRNDHNNHLHIDLNDSGLNNSPS